MFSKKSVESSKDAMLVSFNLQFATLINEISKIEEVEYIDKEKIADIKIKLIELLSNFAIEQIKNPNIWRYLITNSEDFSAFFRFDTNTQKIMLVFEQQMNIQNHYYFLTAEEIIKGLYYLENKNVLDNQNNIANHL